MYSYEEVGAVGNIIFGFGGHRPVFWVVNPSVFLLRNSFLSFLSSKLLSGNGAADFERAELVDHVRELHLSAFFDHVDVEPASVAHRGALRVAHFVARSFLVHLNRE